MQSVGLCKKEKEFLAWRERTWFDWYLSKSVKLNQRYSPIVPSSNRELLIHKKMILKLISTPNSTLIKLIVGYTLFWMANLISWSRQRFLA
jgi:hypothetical protein